MTRRHALKQTLLAALTAVTLPLVSGLLAKRAEAVTPAPESLPPAAPDAPAAPDEPMAMMITSVGWDDGRLVKTVWYMDDDGVRHDRESSPLPYMTTTDAFLPYTPVEQPYVPREGYACYIGDDGQRGYIPHPVIWKAFRRSPGEPVDVSEFVRWDEMPFRRDEIGG